MHALEYPEQNFSKFIVPDQQLSPYLLQIENEFYSDIRPKTVANNERPIVALKEKGVNYVEIRNLDINPFIQEGISKYDLYFLKIFLWYCVFKESPFMNSDEAKACRDDSLFVAENYFNEKSLNRLTARGQSFYLEGIEILNDCMYLATQLEVNRVSHIEEDLKYSVDMQLRKFVKQDQMIAFRLREEGSQFRSDDQFFSQFIMDYNAKLAKHSYSTYNVFKSHDIKDKEAIDFKEFFEGYMQI